MTTLTSTERVALYARISLDDRGDARGVGRQLADAEALSERHGWTIVDRYCDNDVSAYSGKARPEYQRLMRDVVAGKVDRIVVYQSSRLWRSRTERAGDIDRLADAGVRVTAVSGPDLDLSNASGRMLAGILGEFDTAESAIKSERVSRAIRERAEQGRANRVAYGWERIYAHDDRGKVSGWTDIVHPEQGAIVRECADRVIGGDSLHAIAADLNARGAPPPRGATWTGGTVRAVLLRETNAGRMVHRGEVIGTADFPALVPEDVHRAVRSILADPARKVARGNTRKHLLSLGIAVCGACGAAVSVAHRPRKRDGVDVKVAFYRCRNPHCSKTWPQAEVDDLIRAVVVERLSRPDAADLFVRPDSTDRAGELRRSIEGARARLDAAAEDYADALIDRQQLTRITVRLRPVLQEAERDLAGLYRADAAADRYHDLIGDGDPGVVWDGLSVERRRALLEALSITVRLLPRGYGAGGFAPEDVTIEWGAS